MIYILFIILLHFIFFSYKMNGQLNCGIFGALGPKIDMQKIHFLGVLNEKRGEDGAGLVWGGSIYKKESKKYREIMQHLPNKTKSNFVLGHTRKPSRGGATYNNTQPLQLEGTSLAHNGTVTNAADLCKEYGITTSTTDSDSVNLLKLFKKAPDKDWLIRYNGAAALAIRDGDKIYFWRGENNRKNYDFERPLHYTVINGTMYFSSDNADLELIAQKNEILEFEACRLYCFNLKGELLSKELYDRWNPVVEDDPTVSEGIPEILNWEMDPEFDTIYFNYGRYMYNGKPLTSGVDYNKHMTSGSKIKIQTAAPDYKCINGVILAKTAPDDLAKLDFKNLSQDQYSLVASHACEHTIFFDPITGNITDGPTIATGVVKPLTGDTFIKAVNGKIEQVITTDDINFNDNYAKMMSTVEEFISKYEKEEDTPLQTLIIDLNEALENYEDYRSSESDTEPGGVRTLNDSVKEAMGA